MDQYVKDAYEVVATFGITPVKDGNAWCVLLGQNLQEGICGFGDTPHEAIMAFYREFRIPAKKNPEECFEPKIDIKDFFSQVEVREFRKEAATRFAASILANPMWYKRFSGHSVAAQFDNAYFKKHVMCNAISYADALIKELRLKPYKDIRQTHKDTIRVFRPIAGTTIQKAAKEAVEMVKEEGRPIMLSFNSASILVEPYETEDTVCEHYHRWCHSRIAPRESEKKDYGHWKKIAEKKPDDGMDVFLFLGDRRIIRVIWSQGADDVAQQIGIAEQDCYPLYWCEAQMFE